MKYLSSLGRTAVENCKGEANVLVQFRRLSNTHLPSILDLPTRREGIYYWAEEVVPQKLSDYIGYFESDALSSCLLLDQIIDCLSVVRKIKCFHGDLSFDNIGLEIEDLDNRKFVAKILDWGICSTIPGDYGYKNGRKYLGYRLTRPPEVYLENVPTDKSDIWSVSVIAHRLLLRRYPFMWSFAGSPEEWHMLSDEEKRKYEDEVRGQIEFYCDRPEKMLARIRAEIPISPLSALITSGLSPSPQERPDYAQMKLYLDDAIKLIQKP